MDGRSFATTPRSRRGRRAISLGRHRYEALGLRGTSEKVQGVFMEYRQLGKSGLKVPELCFGAGTFGAANEFFKAWSETTQEEANRIVDICMDAGMNLFDTADIYSDGESEKALGKA